MKAKLLAIWQAVKSDLIDTWKRSKIFLLAIGATIVYFEFNKIKEALLVYAGKKEIQSDDIKDQDLARQETKDNTQADALVKEAKDLPSQKGPVSENWYEKKK